MRKTLAQYAGYFALWNAICGVYIIMGCALPLAVVLLWHNVYHSTFILYGFLMMMATVVPSALLAFHYVDADSQERTMSVRPKKARRGRYPRGEWVRIARRACVGAVLPMCNIPLVVAVGVLGYFGVAIGPNSTPVFQVYFYSIMVGVLVLGASLVALALLLVTRPRETVYCDVEEQADPHGDSMRTY